MKKILLIAEDEKFIPALWNYFQFMGFKVRVLSVSPKRIRFGKKAPDLMILSVPRPIGRIATIVEKLCSKVPRIRVVCLTMSKKSHLYDVMGGPKVIFIKETENLHRIYKRIQRL